VVRRRRPKLTTRIPLSLQTEVSHNHSSQTSGCPNYLDHRGYRGIECLRSPTIE
jgi:hypothetical protein